MAEVGDYYSQFTSIFPLLLIIHKKMASQEWLLIENY